MQRSRCTMMFGFAPVTGSGAPVDAEMASSAGSVDSGEASLDAWAEQNLDYPCRLSLGQVEKCRRQQILWMVKEKCERNVVQGNPSAYTQGVIRREINGTPYGRAPTNPHHTSWQPQPPAGQQAPAGTTRSCPVTGGPATLAAAVHAVATPLRAAESAPERPPWVVQAWGVHTRQAALFRLVAANIPSDAMDAIADLPGPWQLVCAQMLLLSKHNYSNPVVFMKTFAEMYRAMPTTGPQIVPSVASPRGSGRPLVVLHLGAASGFEISALQLAAERLVSESHACHVSEIVMVNTGNPWQPVIDELLTGSKSSGPAVLRISPTDASQQLPMMGRHWLAQGAAVVVAVVVPPPMPNHFGAAAQAPSYHAGSARELWGYLSFVKCLAGVLPRVGVLVITGKEEGVSSADSVFFTRHFGGPLSIPHDQVRIPHSGWTLRCCPAAAQPPWVARRLVASQIAECLDPELAAAADANKAFTAVLPHLPALEEIVDKRMKGDALAESETKSLSLLLRRGSGGVIEDPARLLDRSSLAHVFGVNGWRVLDYWTEKMPCGSMVHPFTGQPVAQTFPGALPCGQLRYCPSCANFYDCIMSTPSPFVYSGGIVMAAVSAHFSLDCRPGVDVATLPVHQCEHGCVGHVS